MKNGVYVPLQTDTTVYDEYFNFDTIFNNNISNDYISTYLVRLVACGDTLYFRFDFYNNEK